MINNGSDFVTCRDDYYYIYKEHRKEIDKIYSYFNDNFLSDMKYPSKSYIEKYQLLEEAIKYNPYLLFRFEELIDYNLCKIVVTINGRFIIDILKCKKELVDKDLCKIALMNSSIYLRDIFIALVNYKSELIDKEICELTISVCIDMVHYIPNILQTEDMWMKYISSNPQPSLYYYKISKHILTKRFIRFIINHDMYVVQCILSFSKEETYKCNKLYAPYLGKEYIKRFIQEYNI